MTRFLDSITRKIDIAVESGVASASLDGDIISGKWLQSPKIWTPRSWPRSIAEELLNLTTAVAVEEIPGKVLEFTKKYGVLFERYDRGKTFRFTVSKWLDVRATYVTVWESISSLDKPVPTRVYMEAKDYFEFAERRLQFHTSNLGTYIVLEIAAVPPARLRMCENRLNGCKSPYLIATDLRMRYCSEACANAAAHKAKLRWWNENRKRG